MLQFKNKQGKVVMEMADNGDVNVIGGKLILESKEALEGKGEKEENDDK
jgi:hypothetical protein